MVEPIDVGEARELDIDADAPRRGLCLNVIGELVDVNPDVATVAPVWPTVLDDIRAWCGSSRPQEITVLTTSTSRQQKFYRRLNVSRVEAISKGIAEGAIDSVVIGGSGASTSSGDGFRVTFAMSFASSERRRDRGLDAQYRRRNMMVTLQRFPARYGVEEFDSMSGIVRAFCRYVRPASAFGSLLDEAPSASEPLSGNVAPDRYPVVHGNRDQIFGYDWVQLLTPAVMQALVAHGRDMADLPAEAKVVVPVVDGTEAMLVAIRRSPTDVTDADMRAFREFVLPVLAVTGPPMPGSPAARNPDRSRPRGVLPEDWHPEGSA